MAELTRDLVIFAMVMTFAFVSYVTGYDNGRASMKTKYNFDRVTPAFMVKK
jgi:hypothetical protein